MNEDLLGTVDRGVSTTFATTFPLQGSEKIVTKTNYCKNLFKNLPDNYSCLHRPTMRKPPACCANERTKEMKKQILTSQQPR
jgi:hypothetical protein